MSANIRGISALIVVLCASVAQAGPIEVEGEARASMTADGVYYHVPTVYDEEAGVFVVGYRDDFGNLVEGFTITSAEWQCSISGGLNPDPSISYTISVADFLAPSSFSFTHTTPITPIGGTNTVRASVVGGLTDAVGNGVSITPTLADMDGDGIAEIQIAEVLAPATNMGVDVGLAASHAGTGSLASHPYGSFDAGPIAGPGPGPWVTLTTTTAFMLSGGGDTVALTGFAEIVPEPSTVALAGIGMALMLGYAARRRRAR
jgi:hypothetical protein